MKVIAVIRPTCCLRAAETQTDQIKQEEDSTHKSAKTHASNFLCLVTLAFDLLTSK